MQVRHALGKLVRHRFQARRAQGCSVHASINQTAHRACTGRTCWASWSVPAGPPVTPASRPDAVGSATMMGGGTAAAAALETGTAPLAVCSLEAPTLAGCIISLSQATRPTLSSACPCFSKPGSMGSQACFQIDRHLVCKRLASGLGDGWHSRLQLMVIIIADQICIDKAFKGGERVKVRSLVCELLTVTPRGE